MTKAVQPIHFPSSLSSDVNWSVRKRRCFHKTFSALHIFDRIKFADGEGLLDENDAILMKGNYRNVWIHKCSFTNYLDALINIEKVIRC